MPPIGSIFSYTAENLSPIFTIFGSSPFLSLKFGLSLLSAADGPASSGDPNSSDDFSGSFHILREISCYFYLIFGYSILLQSALLDSKLFHTYQNVLLSQPILNKLRGQFPSTQNERRLIRRIGPTSARMFLENSFKNDQNGY